MFDLQKPFTAGTAVKEEDARAMKIALNHLGYYAPNPKLGITAIPDRAVFTALQAFQKDHGLQQTATAKPHDKTVEALNAETERQDSSNGQYIWRTVQDDHVRSSHRQREGLVFSWNAAPEGGHPGEDYNCRCWAESIKKSSCEQEEVDFANASAAYFIAKQNLDKAQERLNVIREELKTVIAQIEKEKKDKEAARRIGGAAGAIVGGIAGARGGAGAALKGASKFIGIGGNLGTSLEEIADAVTNENTLVYLEQKKAALEKEIGDLEKKISGELQSALEKSKKNMDDAKVRLKECKEREKYHAG